MIFFSFEMYFNVFRGKIFMFVKIFWTEANKKIKKLDELLKQIKNGTEHVKVNPKIEYAFFNLKRYYFRPAIVIMRITFF